MEDRTLLLCIVLGLSWRDFSAAWRPADAVLSSAAIRMTVASALFLTAVGLVFTAAHLWIGLATTGLGAMIAVVAKNRITSDVALVAAATGFAVYFAGMTS